MDLHETLLAFLEGLALIASPCILPVLPLVLSASVDGGRRRPFGIITGFVISFSLFVFLSRKLVSALHIQPAVIQNASLVLLFLFGLVLLSSKLSEKFSSLTQGVADIGNRAAANSQGGYVSGIAIGALIGLVWTPCAGPVLATVLVQVIREQSDSAAYLMIFAFALGAGVPMLVIALAGRKIMGRVGFLTSHTEAFRKGLGVIILLSVAFIASGVDVQSLFSSAGKTESATTPLALEDALKTPYPAPDFAPGETWINSKPLLINDLKGKVVLIDFWTYSCINCLRTLPYLKDWYAKYHDKGLEIIGVHSPEFEFEKNEANVRQAITDHGILYPVVMDNTLSTWTNFANQYWPAHYLINKDGQVVYTHFGEGKYDITENNIRYLLGLKGKAQGEAAAAPYRTGQTPETYLGTARRIHFAGEGAAMPASLPLHHWALTGKWKSTPQNITAIEPGATLRLHFKAARVFLVMGTASGKPIHVVVRLMNRKFEGPLTVKSHRLYMLVYQSEFQEGVVQITAIEPGLEAYAFTFGE